MSKPAKEDLIYIDELTGIYNRRYLKEKQGEMEKLKEKNIPFSLAIVDIDHFKEINDTYGHVKGDEVIRVFSEFLKSSLRTSDTVVRYGGDEFVSVMPDLRRKDSEQIYARILNRCKTRDFGGLNITISAGIASYPDDGKDFDELLKIADESLYDAKRSGRDRIGGTGKKRIKIPSKVFISRKEEKEALRRFLTENDAGAQVAIIKGNVGIGKTRLVKEVLSNIRGREIILSDCLALFEEMPYYAIREMIKYKIGRQGEGILEDIPLPYRIEIGKLIPEIKELMKGRIEDLELVLDKYRLYESVKRIVEIGDSSKILVIDNMQWADKGTIEIIKYLLRSLRNNPITFIITYRQEEKTRVLEDFTSYISRETEVREIGLKPFEYNEIREMVRSIIGEEPGRALVEYIEEESGGNSFYIEEIIKGLNESGYLRIAGEEWEFERPMVELVPKSIEDITERKYQSLSNEGKEVLEIGSVIGRFDVDIIKGITGYNEGHIVGILENIKRLGLLKEHGDRIEFQEEISRNAIYKRDVGEIKARMLHRKVAEELQEQYKGKEEEAVDELAFHYYRGGQRDKGVKFCVDAGDIAKEKYANISAIEYYTWAIEYLRNETKADRKLDEIECLKKRARVLISTGENEKAAEDLRKAINKAKEIGSKEKEAGCLVALCEAYQHMAQYNKAAKLAEMALKIYRKLNECKGEATILINIGNIYCNFGKYQDALEFYKCSLEIAEEIGDRQTVASSLNNIGIVYCYLGNYSRALEFLHRVLKISEEIGDCKGEALNLNNIGMIHGNLDNYTKAFEFTNRSLKIQENIGERKGEAMSLGNIGIIYENLGEYTRALEFQQHSLKIFKEIAVRDGEARALIGIGNIFIETDDFSTAERYYNKAYSITREIKSKPILADVFFGLISLYLKKNNLVKVKRVLKQILSLADELGSKEMNAEALYLSGRLYTKERKWDKAKSSFKKSIAILEKLKRKSKLAKAYYYQGLMFKESGNKIKAKENFTKAMKIFKKLDFKRWIQKIKKSRSVL